MKAYMVVSQEVNENEIVFAESAGKAKTIALAGDYFKDVSFIELRVVRFPELDKEWRGHNRMDWNDKRDRDILCDYGWTCVSDEKNCNTCFSKEHCQWYDYLLNGDEWLEEGDNT